MNQSCWEILGIEPTDDQDIIRNAYRQKLPLYHPENDPQGFQNLRQAYEQARKGIQPAFSPVSALTASSSQEQELSQNNEQEEVPPEEEVAQIHPEQPAIDRLTADFEALLNNAQKRYQPDAWHEYIQQLDNHSIEVVNQLRWPLLLTLFNADCISRNCAMILAERMRWKQRLNEIQGESVHRLDEFLDFIAKKDIFDLTLLSELPFALQNATFEYISSIHFLFWERAPWMLKAFLEQPTAVYWPDSPELMELRCRWYTYAGFGYDELSNYCLDKLTDDPDNIDWLYLYASQCSLSGHDEKALPFWVHLYELERHATAEEWLLNWTKNHTPERLPLLIQAMDNPQYAPAQDITVDSPDQSYVTPTQSTKSLLRWGEALQHSLPQIAQDYANWRIYKAPQTAILRHIINDDGSNPLLHLYRHASMLKLGNEELLQQIIEEPQTENVLDNLILNGFKHQAKQRVIWLRNSQVIATFNQWLYASQEAVKLPDIFNDRNSDAYQQCLHYLLQRNWLPDEQLARLVNSEQFGDNLEIVTDWISFISLHNDLPLPKPIDGEDYWEWCRKCYALVLLLEKPAESLEYILQMKNLTIEEDHPLYEFEPALKAVVPEQGDIIKQYMNALSLDRIIQFHSWTRLNITPQDYLDNTQTTRSYSIDHFYLSSNLWREQVAKSKKINQLVFLATCAYFSYSNRHDRFMEFIEEVEPNNEQEAALKETLINNKNHYPLAQEITNPRLHMLINKILLMHHHPEYVLPQETYQFLLNCQQNANEDITLRLAAKHLLQESDHRSKSSAARQSEPISEKVGSSSIWQFWRIGTRLNRVGYAVTLIVGPILLFIIGVLLSIFISSDTAATFIIISFFLNIICASIRRFNDLNYSRVVSLILTCIVVLIPIGMIYLLFAPGVSFTNKAGPPPPSRFN